MLLQPCWHSLLGSSCMPTLIETSLGREPDTSLWRTASKQQRLSVQWPEKKQILPTTMWVSLEEVPPPGEPSDDTTHLGQHFGCSLLRIWNRWPSKFVLNYWPTEMITLYMCNLKLPNFGYLFWVSICKTINIVMQQEITNTGGEENRDQGQYLSIVKKLIIFLTTHVKISGDK